MTFRALIERMTAAACAGDGAGVAACFTADGVYHDVFYGAFTGVGIAEMIEGRFHRDARDFRWDLHECLDDGQVGMARYLFSYTSTLPGHEGRRAMFEGVAICQLRDRLIARYSEVAESAVGLSMIGFTDARLARFIDRQARDLASQHPAP